MRYQLNLIDYRCPLPLLMLKKTLHSLSQDDELEVTISRESAAENFEDLGEKTHCELVKKYPLSENKYLLILYKKA